MTALLASICAGPYLCEAGDVSLQLVSPERLSKIGVYDRLVERTQERVLFAPNGFKAWALLFVLPVPYKAAVPQILTPTRIAFGDAAVRESVTVIQRAKPQPGDPPGILRMEEEHVAHLNRLGIPQGTRFDEALITTAAYNHDRDTDDHSVLYVRIADAQPLFKRDCALLAIARVDHTREWYRTFHLGIPFPLKGASKVELVTETEVNFIKRLEDELQVPLRKTMVYGSGVDEDFSSFDVASHLESLKPFVDRTCSR